MVVVTGNEHLNTIAYSKEENGMVERANKEINRHLRAILFEKAFKGQWSRYLPTRAPRPPRAQQRNALQKELAVVAASSREELERRMEELRAREEFDLGAAERNALQKELAVVAASSREELEWRMEELPLLRPAGRS